MERKKFLTTFAAVLLFSCVVRAEGTDGYSVVRKEDFENFEVGVLVNFEGHDTFTSDNISFEGYSGDKLEIAEENGNKFLKITIQDKSTSNKILKYYFDAVTGGEVRVSYDFIPKVSSKYFDKFGALQTGSKEQNSSVAEIKSYWANAYLDAVGSDYFIARALSSTERKDIRISQTVEIGKGDYNFDMVSQNTSNGNTEVVHYGKKVTAPKNIIGLSWIVRNGDSSGYNGPDSNEDSSNAGVYYIDNITVEQKVFCVEQTQPKNESKDVLTDQEIKLTFNSEAADNFKDYIEVYSGDTKLNDGYEIIKNGKILTVKFGDGLKFNENYKVLVKKGLSASDSKYVSSTEDYTLKFKTESILPEISGAEEGKNYNKETTVKFSPREGTNISAEISYNGGEFGEYVSGTPLTKEGSYTLRLKAERQGKEEVRIINFGVVGLVAPRAEDVKISNDGLVYTGNYKYVDDNADEEDKQKTELIWEIKDSETADWKEVSRGDKITVTEDMVGKILRFSVIPAAVNEPKIGKAVYSEEIYLPARPFIEGDVVIIGEERKVWAEYTYKDNNGDEESGTVFEWFRADEEGNIKSKIDNAKSKEYTISETDINGYIVCKVIPKNEGLFGEGTEYVSKPFLLPYIPEIKNLKINNAYSGKSAQAAYEFFDRNGDKEAASKIEWYLNGELVSTAPGYYIDKNASGTLTLRVTPVAEKYPFEGNYQEVSVNIKKQSSSGGSGGGGYTISAGNGVAKVEPEICSESNNRQPTTQLNDISGHWAQKAIERLLEEGIVTGDENQNFNPDSCITRAEVSAILARTLNLEEKYRKLFEDVKAEDWYADYVCAVANEKIMNGDGLYFRPNDKITREEMCVVLRNILNYKNIEAKKGILTYKDSEAISACAKEAVEVCVGEGLVNGMDDNSFAPKQTATKAQIAVMIERVLEYEEK